MDQSKFIYIHIKSVDHYFRELLGVDWDKSNTKGLKGRGKGN